MYHGLLLRNYSHRTLTQNLPEMTFEIRRVTGLRPHSMQAAASEEHRWEYRSLLGKARGRTTSWGAGVDPQRGRRSKVAVGNIFLNVQKIKIKNKAGPRSP